MKNIILLSLIFTMSSCAFMTSVSQTSIPKDKSKVVTAKAEKNIIFFFSFSNDYVNNLTKDLIKQCPNGSVKGILTKDESIVYFPIVFSKSVVTATGYCVEERKRSSKAKRRTRSSVKRR